MAGSLTLAGTEYCSAASSCASPWSIADLLVVDLAGARDRDVGDPLQLQAAAVQAQATTRRFLSSARDASLPKAQ